ncbi:2TM domain-containing protein [Candidatus Kaistella beijingensis]|uniref:2TM domain-containing protein n=1 Tax=Candidatus Kaistella beijingensis TaxID=2820270 RepID=UPI001CC3370F|nr:2TM domain-containing protein [Candidatus Kaistella beijingensis]UBB89018.1 2TM domain-containing protein [Candidatus Kaistella beijingensis]
MNRKSFTNLVWVAFFISITIFIFFNEDWSPLNALLTFAISLMYSLIIGLGNGFVNDFLTRRFSWVEQTKTRVILGIIATFLVNVILVLLCNYVTYILILKKNATDFFTGNMGISNWITINIALLVSAILHAKSFMEEWKKSTRKEVVEQKIIAKSANAQFESLKNQLDPHFLFNSLNVLSSLIDENPNLAQRFTSSMSKIYRYVLEQKDKELVTVEEELDFAKTYCELLKTRFEDSVNFEVEVKDKKGFVVPLSLQLLLENCIKHNFATSAKPLIIKIYSENGNLIVENNLQAREQVKEREGIGLSNIVQRYSLITNRNVFIEKSEDYFKVKLPILTQKISAMNTNNSNEQIAYQKAAKRVEELKGFYGNLISYCIFIPFLFLINWKTSPNYYWAFWPMFGWGIGVIAHGIQVFGIGRDWEEKQIKKFMQKEESKEWK